MKWTHNLKNIVDRKCHKMKQKLRIALYLLDKIDVLLKQQQQQQNFPEIKLWALKSLLVNSIKNLRMK